MNRTTFFLCVLLSTTVATQKKVQNEKRHQISKKKYVIEVQDHQQAVKGANPIVDLEDTVRRGINDPLADPRFVMNRINGDFFGIPTDNSLHNNELFSYQGRDRLSSSMFGVRNFNPLTPSNPIQQHATKEEIVARHPASIAMYQDLGLPRQPLMHHALINHRRIQAPTRTLPMSSFDGDVSANIAQNVAGGLALGLPGSIAAFSHPKNGLAPFARGVSLGRFTPQIVHNQKAALLSHIQKGGNRIFPHRNIKPQRNFYYHNSNSISNVNPLTGLPDDLEDRSYGAVSSITSISDPPPPLPSTVTVTAGESIQTSEAQPKQEATAVSSQHEEASAQTPTQNILDDNFSSLKAFLEADNILRAKLDKDGIESIYPSKKKANLDSALNLQQIGSDRLPFSIKSSKRTLPLKRFPRYTKKRTRNG